MFALAYNSEASVPFDDDRLERLASRSGTRNRNVGITGYLYFRDSQFLQYLEGQEDAVRTLMNRISADPRHRVTGIFEIGEIDERLFPEWAMRYIGRDLPKRGELTVEDELRSIIVHGSDTRDGEESLVPAVLQVTRRIAGLDW